MGGKWRLDKTKLIETEVEVEDELNAYMNVDINIICFYYSRIS